MVGVEKSKGEGKTEDDRKLAGPLRIKPEGVEKKPDAVPPKPKVEVNKAPPPPVLPRKTRVKQVAVSESPAITALFVLCVLLGIATVMFLTYPLLGKEIQSPALRSVVEFCRKIPTPGAVPRQVEQEGVPSPAEESAKPQADAEED